MLLTMMLVISLLIIETYRDFQSSATLAIAIILIIMPLLAFLVMVVYLHRTNIKKTAVFCINAIKKPTKPADYDRAKSEDIEMHEHDVIVNQQLRDRSTTTV